MDKVSRLSTISDSDKEAIEKLRLQSIDRLLSVYTDFDLLRWLRGYDYDFDSVTPKLRHHLRVLRSYDFAKAPANPVLDSYWPRGMLDVTTGKDDNFVYIDCVGATDGEGVLKCVPVHVFMIYFFAYMENVVIKAIRRRERDTGRQSGLVLIYDCDKARMNAPTLAQLAGPYRLFLQNMIEHYVEILQKGILVNAPYFVQLIWRLVSPALPEKTKRKFIILGSNWRTELLQYVKPESLPVHWGGLLVDANNDSKYSSHIVIPSTVPSDYYWNRCETDPSPEDMQILYVSAGRSSVVTFAVDDVGSILSWFFTADADFGFGVFYTMEDSDSDDVDNMEMVYPQFRQMPGPSVIPEIDQITCQRSGFYKLWFGNERSWLRKLKIQYSVRITKPE